MGNISPSARRKRECTVHPHAYGEHWLGSSPTVPFTGSSPRVWERWLGSSPIVPFTGSSPRVWGTYIWRGFAESMHRFIPTRVGNMRAVIGCGSRQDGSSPHVWGTWKRTDHDARGDRFIPTRVGNISRGQKQARRATVHPHACGEHNSYMVTMWTSRRFIPTRVGNMNKHDHDCDCDIGSSPRVWGTSASGRGSWPTRRFIPTRVGNMIFPAASEPSQFGSSPRVWGTFSVK